MSAAACAKKILCDPDVHLSQGIANALEFLGVQIKEHYQTSPESLIEIKDELSAAMAPHLKEAEKAGAAVLNKYI